MFQHVVVFVIFALCLYWVVRRIVRLMSRVKKGNPRCETCTEGSCPLRDASLKSKKCGCR